MTDPLTEARADRDRARTIAVHLEQEVAMLTIQRHRFAENYARHHFPEPAHLQN